MFSALLVSTSVFNFNYRHSSNVLSLYSTLTALAVPPDRIVAYVAYPHAADARNTKFGSQRALAAGADIYNVWATPEIRLSGWGSAVTPDALLGSILGDSSYPELAGGEDTDWLIYLTGHGGDGFLKFHDRYEVTGEDLSVALAAAQMKGRFRSATVIFDTCQADTLNEGFYRVYNYGSAFNSRNSFHMSQTGTSRQPDKPNGNKRMGGLVTMASSIRDENSYASGVDYVTGQSIMDGFTRHLFHVLKEMRNEGYALNSRAHSVQHPTAVSITLNSHCETNEELPNGRSRRRREMCDRAHRRQQSNNHQLRTSGNPRSVAPARNLADLVAGANRNTVGSTVTSKAHLAAPQHVARAFAAAVRRSLPPEWSDLDECFGWDELGLMGPVPFMRDVMCTPAGGYQTDPTSESRHAIVEEIMAWVVANCSNVAPLHPSTTKLILGDMVAEDAFSGFRLRNGISFV